MFNNYIIPYTKPLTEALPIPSADEEICELVFKYITFIIDTSLSMEEAMARIQESFKGTLSMLHNINKNSIDINNIVKLAFFNNDTTPFNNVHQPPEKLIDMLSDENFKCKGCTNEGSVIKFIDSELSRKNPAVASLKKKLPRH